MDKINVVLVDDHKLFRDGVKSLLDNTEDIQVIAQFSNAKQFISSIEKIQFHVLITDISMDGMNGIELTRYITANYPCIQSIILSMHNNKDFILSSMDAGAKAYLPKDIAGTELCKAIKEVSAGREYFNQMISNTIMHSLMQTKKSNKTNKEDLTSREKEVLILASDGFLNKEIAEKLCISVRTVDCHKNNIMSKLNLHTTAELVKYAIINHYINLDSK